MNDYKIFADFNNADKEGRLRLITRGSIDDISKQKIKLEPGLKVLVYDNGSLEADAVVEFSESEKIWVAAIDWHNIKTV